MRSDQLIAAAQVHQIAPASSSPGDNLLITFGCFGGTILDVVAHDLVLPLCFTKHLGFRMKKKCVLFWQYF